MISYVWARFPDRFPHYACDQDTGDEARLMTAGTDATSCQGRQRAKNMYVYLFMDALA